MTRTTWLAAASAALLAACGQTQSAQNTDDIRGVEEINSSDALTALVGVATFNATTGAMSVPLDAASDKLLIVSRRAIDNAILLNGRSVTDAAGVMAVATGSTGLLKTLSITVGADGTTVVLDYLNGYFAPGVTGTFTAAAPMVQGTTVNFAAHSACAFKIRTTGSADTVYFGKDKTASANKLVSFNNGNFADVWIKTSGTPAVALAYAISLGAGNDVFNASPGPAVLGGLLASFTDPIVIHGGAGDDTLTGGKGQDTIYGDEGDNLIDESAYLDGVTVTASATRTLTFNAAKTITASSGSFVTDGFTSGQSIIVSGTTANGSTASPKTYTLSAVAATVLTVAEAVVTETAYAANATVVQPSTVHPKDTVYGLAASGTTTVTYAARPLARAGAGVVVKVGHDTAVPPAWLAGTEDNIDETVAVVVGTDFPDTMSCSDTTDAPCTLVGGKGNDRLSAGMSAIHVHKLYGGDGADTLIVTGNTDKALLMGGNWTDAARPAVAVTASGSRTLTFNVAKTITASSGSFITDGFLAGQSIVVTGTTGNGTTAGPKTFTIAAGGVAATALTVVEAVVTEAAYSANATVTQPAVVAPRNASIDTVDYGALTAAAATIDLSFPLPTAAKGYTAAAPYSGAAGKLHTNITKDISRARCPQTSALQVCTFTGNNSGNWVVAGKGADVLTGGTGDDTFDLGASDAAVVGEVAKVVTGGGGTDSVDFSGRTLDTAIDLSCALSSCKTSGTKRLDPGITVSASATRTLTFDAAKTITAGGTAPGSFLLDGFAAGQSITVSGTTANDGTYTIASVTAAVLTVNEVVATEAAYAATAAITRAPADAGMVITASGARTLTFDATNKKIIASSGDFTTEGFADGQSIVVAGTTANDGTYTIAASGVAATELIVVEALTDEGPISATATITRAPAAKLVEGISLVGITNATCPASAGVLACTLTGSSASNIMDFNGCTGTVTCGGGADIILNAAAGVDTHCGI